MHIVTGTPPIGDALLADTAPGSSQARPGPQSGEWSGPSAGASVMVEIGEGTGALVVYVGAELEGEEIEIRPHGQRWTGRHTGVRARHLGQRVLHAGVFGSLPAGPYDLRLRPSPSAAEPTGTIVTAAVKDATVVEITLI